MSLTRNNPSTGLNYVIFAHNIKCCFEELESPRKQLHTDGIHQTISRTLLFLLLFLVARGNIMYIHVTANLRNQLFPGIPNPLRESGESQKCIEILWNL